MKATKEKQKRKSNTYTVSLVKGLGALLILFVAWHVFRIPPTVANWEVPLARLSTADINGDQVLVHNVRNFRYNGSEKEEDLQVAYYDKTYDLTKLTKVWYITEPFKDFNVAAHTFLSFEFSNGDFLSITIEARERKEQKYDLFMGLLHTYPIMYIAADERDAVYMRTHIRKSDIYVYPVKLAKPENARFILLDMLQYMNNLAVHPRWYNTAFANCTSMIAYHVNRVSPHRLPSLRWQVWATGYADELALNVGLLDTNLPLDQARKKYYVSARSEAIGLVPDYSQQIRQFDKPSE